MRKPKVVVVGAGPAGSACALALRKLDAAEVLLLDKSAYPRVKVCGSGLSPLALRMLDRLDIRDRFTANHGLIRALIVRGPGGGETTLRGKAQAWVVPRTEFDHAVAKASVSHGARFQEETKATELIRDARGDVRGVRTTRGDVEADLVVCADGSPSRFSRDESPKTTIRTLMGWWRGTTLPHDEAIMVWDRRLDGYYAWSFPEPCGVTNVGITIPEGAPDATRLKELFTDILAEHFDHGLRGAEQVGKWMGHPAVVTTRVGEVAESRAMWIGEAARLVMPATAEGIGFALQSGLLAGEMVAKHFRNETGFSRLACRRYRVETATRMLPKFWAGEAFVRVMRSERARTLSDRLMHSRIKQLAERAVSNLVGGDVDGARVP